MLSRPNGRAATWKSRGPKTLSRQNCKSPTLFFGFGFAGKGEGCAPRSRRTESIATMSLWVDKHRPRCLDQLRVHSKPARQLQKLLAGGDCPHLLFYGPSGAGKKTLCLAALREVGDLYLHPPLRPPPLKPPSGRSTRPLGFPAAASSAYDLTAVGQTPAVSPSGQ